MSLNDKYIINGSTLSDIGDALRAKEIIPPTKKVSQTIWYKEVSDSSGWMGEKHSITIDSAYFGLDQTVSKIKIIPTQIDNVLQIGGNNISNGYVGVAFIYSLPVTASVSGSRYSTYSYTMKVYPLDSNENFIIPKENERSSYSSEQQMMTRTNFIEVDNIANTILNDFNNTSIAFLAPFQIGASSNYTNATVFPTNIKKITDIKKLFFVSSNSDSSYITIQKLEPANTTTQHYSSMGGLGAGTTYRMKEYSFPYWDTAPADWDDKLNNSTIGYDVYFIESTRQLVQISGGGSYIINAYAIPALLIY